jgi:disulfide bond formation protein DsbB
MARIAGSGAGALTAAKLIALLVPAALLAGAYGSEIFGGLIPCEMCWWQRYAHFAALALAAASFLFSAMPDRGRSFVWLAALAILTSGGIALYHLGIEAGIFVRACGGSCRGPYEEMMKCLMRPKIPCDAVQWADPVIGISMAGWNAIISVAAALVVGWLSLKRPGQPALA